MQVFNRLSERGFRATRGRVCVGVYPGFIGIANRKLRRYIPMHDNVAPMLIAVCLPIVARHCWLNTVVSLPLRALLIATIAGVYWAFFDLGKMNKRLSCYPERINNLR